MYENEIQSFAARESDAEIYAGLLQLTKDIAKQKGQIQGKKKLYYISAEFLIGKLLSNNLINLGIYDQVANALKEHGKSLAQIEEIENEPSLGNGGLGRLAACFLDSIATLGLPGDGVGLNYHLGLFQQKFENNLQKETPNPWITDPSVLRRTNVSYPVIFGGQTVQSVMYEIDVTGYDNQCNTLKLFDLDTVDESIVEGDGINFDKEDIRRNLTLFLYPDDSDYQGEGLYQTPEEVKNSATMGDFVAPGDIRYKNFADGDPDNPLISTDYDRRVLGSSLPHFNYGGSIDLAWRGIDFNLTFQGVGKRNSYLTDEMVQPLRSQWYNFASYIGGGNSWSRKNTQEQNRHVKYPRYSWNSANNNYAISDYWLFDGSYFRVKNLSLGYTLPQKWMNKIHVKSLRFAVTLTDFFTHSHFPEGWDPEVGTTGYPITKSVLFSAQLKF